MVEEKIITFRKPVSLGKGEAAVVYEGVTLREPTALELANALDSGNGIRQAISLIHQVGKLPLNVALRLSQRDLEECSDFLGGFGDAWSAPASTSASSSPATGGT